MLSLYNMLGSNNSLLNIGQTNMSATGNPRNKCALKPGYSLMGWVRLGNSGVDLAGTGGRITPVTTNELAKHNKRDDAWMAIRGNVYNVTKYMDYHPGGEEELMRGVGRDATQLFNEVHAWVNYQQLLAKCLIGPLRTPVQTDKSIKEIAEYELCPPKLLSARCVEVVPRFDWTQKRDEVTIYVYTRNNCNPGLLVRRLDEKNIQLRIQIEHVQHLLSLEFEKAVQWPPRSIKIAAGGTGKIEVNILKATPNELWTTFGAHAFTKCNLTDAASEDETMDFKLVAKEKLNHDSFLMQLRSRDVLLLTPVGYHLSILESIHDECVERSYTPVPLKFIPNGIKTEDSVSRFDVHFLIKNYDNGKLSSHLNQLNINRSVKLAAQNCSFRLDTLLSHRRFAFLAAGSGLTPFLSLLEQLLQRNTNRIEHIQLYYFNKTEADIWCKDILEHLQVDDERFHLTNVLSQSNGDWIGLTGHVTKDILASLLDKNNDQYVTYVAICGPTVFNRLASELLLQNFQFNEQNLHVFQS